MVDVLVIMGYFFVIIGIGLAIFLWNNSTFSFGLGFVFLGAVMFALASFNVADNCRKQNGIMDGPKCFQKGPEIKLERKLPK